MRFSCALMLPSNRSQLENMPLPSIAIHCHPLPCWHMLYLLCICQLYPSPGRRLKIRLVKCGRQRLHQGALRWELSNSTDTSTILRLTSPLFHLFHLSHAAVLFIAEPRAKFRGTRGQVLSLFTVPMMNWIRFAFFTVFAHDWCTEQDYHRKGMSELGCSLGYEFCR